MKFYTTQHPYYCGIDFHASFLYVCILDAAGDTILHREIKALPENLPQGQIYLSTSGSQYLSNTSGSGLAF